MPYVKIMFKTLIFKYEYKDFYPPTNGIIANLWKRNLLRFLLLIVVMALTTNHVSADNVIVDGLEYSCDFLNKKATLVALSNGEKYAGDIVVPSKILVKDEDDSDVTEFTVAELGGYVFDDCTELKSVFLPGTVTSLGPFCFFGCTKLKSLSLPNTISSLGMDCFGDCTSLVHVNIPTSVTELPNGCFAGCSNLCEIMIPSSVSVLGSECFAFCTSLTNITIPRSISSLSYWCFAGCSNLKKVIIPSSVISLDICCFSECVSLENIDIPSTVTSIGQGCFSECSKLQSINIPYGVTTLGNTCFAQCTSLTNVILPSSLKTIDERCFWKCTALKSIILPSNLKSLGMECFRDCKNLMKINIPFSVEKLGSGCFQDCSNLSSITLPSDIQVDDTRASLAKEASSSSLVSIEEECFLNCNSLTKIKIPSSVTMLGSSCFMRTGLSSIYFEGQMPSGIVSSGIPSSCVIYALEDYLQDYKITMGNSNPEICKWDGKNEPTSISQVKTQDVEITSHGGVVNLSGLTNEEKVAFYTVEGKLVGIAIVKNGVASCVIPGSMAIVKVANKVYKIVVK